LASLEEKALHERLERIETLIQAIETFADPAARASAKEVIQTLMDLHGAGLEQMLNIVAEAGMPGEAIIDRFGRDDLVGSLLLLYGLHPLDMDTRVRMALDKARPYLKSHGGNVELLGITDDGVVRLRLEGSCHGCPSSAMTLKLTIEEGIYALAPDVAAIQVEGLVERPTSAPLNFIPLELASSEHSTRASGGWEQVNGLSSLGQGKVRMIDVSGRSLLFCRVDETFYAYSDTCPACRQKLGATRLEATALVCPNCGHRYDVIRAGRAQDEPSLYLEPYPLLMEHGQAKVALPDLR
jgi:Fe-S cluster biogenesis protein NfuA/nitrite reductase/ring-hydroxylating ferredoxin subunit